MIKLDREQLLSTGALGALLLICAIATTASFQMRSDAVQSLARARSGAVAPAAAFLDAPTQGLAGAQLQARLEQMAAVHHAVLISSSIEPAKREDPPDSIRLQVTLDVNLQALQTLLYQLESGTPYVFVESLAVQVSGATSQRVAEDPLLRTSFGLRAVWRRGKA
jgi:general secretion pathway protein M